MRVMNSVVVNMKSFRRRSFPIRRPKRLSPSDRSKLPRTDYLDVRKTRHYFPLFRMITGQREPDTQMGIQ